MKHISLLLAGAALLAASAASAPAATVTAKMKEAVADPARPDADKARDENRKPAEMLAFAGITPGKVVVDLLPGAGYFTRIFAKAVGPSGHVYAIFPQFMAEFDKADVGRISMLPSEPGYGNVSYMEEPSTAFSAPEPLDMVWTSDNYHDLQFALKRAKAGELMLGGAAEHRAVIAEEFRAAHV